MIKAVLFDFDGTLVTSLPHLHAAWGEAFKTQGKELSHEEVVDIFYAPREERASRHGLDTDALHAAYAAMITPRRAQYTLHEGVAELLGELARRQVHCAIISYSREAVISSVLQTVGADTFFELVLGRDSVTHPKPDPESVFRALDHFGVAPHEALMVGDAQVDIETGERAGVPTALYLPDANHRYRDNEALASLAPDYRFAHYRELVPIIDSIS